MLGFASLSPTYYLVGASAGEGCFHRWFECCRRPDEELTIRAVTSDTGALGVVGPNAREVLESLAEADVGSESLPFMGALHARVGPAATWILRVSYVGELGFELHHAAECQLALYRALREVGASIAAAYLPAALAEPGVGLDIEILGARQPARVVPDPLYDRTNRRMRA